MDDPISINNAKPGMILKKPVTDRSGRVIINAGTSLSPLFISKLQKWGIEKVWVEEVASDAGEQAVTEAPAAVDASAESDVDAQTRQRLAEINAKIEAEIEFRFSEHKENKIMMGLKELAKKRLLKTL